MTDGHTMPITDNGWTLPSTLSPSFMVDKNPVLEYLHRASIHQLIAMSAEAVYEINKNVMGF